MSETEDCVSGITIWASCESLATVAEDAVGEEIEEMAESSGWKVEFAGKRLNSEGEECEEQKVLDESYLPRVKGRWAVREEDLFLIGVECEDEHFESLSGNSWSKEQQCVFCEVVYLNYFIFLKYKYLF